MTKLNPDVSIILPAFNEGAIIGMVIKNIDNILADGYQTFEILIVDDGSSDNTAEEANNAGARVISHPYNIGNGAAIKTGIRNARGGILVMLDADGQHPPEDIPSLLAKIGPYDMAVGARTSSSESAIHRDIANHINNDLPFLGSVYKLKDLRSGLRTSKSEAVRGNCLPVA